MASGHDYRIYCLTEEQHLGTCSFSFTSECRCRLSKYHSQKPESTRRTIFNRDSTLQLIVQISSGNVNSSVRARAKTHGCTPVLVELLRGRHLGSDACIFWARMLASTLHKSAQQEAPEACNFYVQEHN